VGTERKQTKSKDNRISQENISFWLSLSMDGRQLFCQYDTVDSKTFLQYLKCLKRKYRRFIFFYDGAPWHKEEKVKEFFEKNKDFITPVFFPQGSPEFDPVEECWKQGKDHVLGSTYPPSFEDLKKQVSCYYRTKRFHLSLINYLCHTAW
jgi:transposase